MPNPRFMSREGEPTVELLIKLHQAKKVYFDNLDGFCAREFTDNEAMRDILEVYLIGSHAEEERWNNDTSDVDLKIVNPTAIPEHLFRYKRKVLDRILCASERKRDWVDLFFVPQNYQVLAPRWDVTRYWNQIEFGLGKQQELF